MLRRGGDPKTPVREGEGTRGPSGPSWAGPKWLDGATLRSPGVFVLLTGISSRLSVSTGLEGMYLGNIESEKFILPILKLNLFTSQMLVQLEFVEVLE